ncbi:integrase catalytic region [Caballeronia sordidicola]|uniref:Integrase catalytic region n=1 Tax=Caballeronia sordidicola TaxID=196367 RepID=A0A158HGQ6_CABSO|nr:integrase catalytic region [Caballeronia sordidicola]
MYSYKDRVQAVQLYLKLGKRIKATFGRLKTELFYPRD